MKYNTIYTYEEYKAQGFETWELPLITEFDTLHNKMVNGNTTVEDEQRYYELVDILKL